MLLLNNLPIYSHSTRIICHFKICTIYNALQMAMALFWLIFKAWVQYTLNKVCKQCALPDETDLNWVNDNTFFRMWSCSITAIVAPFMDLNNKMWTLCVPNVAFYHIYHELPTNSFDITSTIFCCYAVGFVLSRYDLEMTRFMNTYYIKNPTYWTRSKWHLKMCCIF